MAGKGISVGFWGFLRRKNKRTTVVFISGLLQVEEELQGGCEPKQVLAIQNIARVPATHWGRVLRFTNLSYGGINALLKG